MHNSRAQQQLQSLFSLDGRQALNGDVCVEHVQCSMRAHIAQASQLNSKFAYVPFYKITLELAMHLDCQIVRQSVHSLSTARKLLLHLVCFNFDVCVMETSDSRSIICYDEIYHSFEIQNIAAQCLRHGLVVFGNSAMDPYDVHIQQRTAPSIPRIFQCQIKSIRFRCENVLFFYVFNHSFSFEIVSNQYSCWATSTHTHVHKCVHIYVCARAAPSQNMNMSYDCICAQVKDKP